MAGLLGVGGGIIMVPALYYAFTVLDFDISNKNAFICWNFFSYYYSNINNFNKTHMEYDAVDFKMVKSFGIIYFDRCYCWNLFSCKFKTPTLVLFFSIFAFMVGLFFIFLREKLVENPKTISNTVKNISGIIIGFISIPLGIGGGSLMVPFMRTFGYDIRKSIGTAAAIGFLISLSGAVTMVIGGKIINNVTTPFSVGYINLLGFIVFVPVTMVMARIGAKVVYKIDRKLLSKIFGAFLIIVSIRSFIEYLNIN